MIHMATFWGANFDLPPEFLMCRPENKPGGPYFLATEEKPCRMSLTPVSSVGWFLSSRHSDQRENRTNNMEETMGFDLFSARGAYLRHSNGTWGLLWGFVTRNCNGILTGEDIEATGRIGGYVIANEKAIALANRLDELLIQRLVPDSGPDAPYSFLQDVRDFAVFCRTSGGFSIW
jgi:hypothetical protein